MPVRTSNLPSYDKIFAIKIGAVNVISPNDIIPHHRGLLVAATGNSTLFTFTNFDETTCGMQFTTGSIVLPLQIKSYSYTETPTNISIYGLF